MIMMINTKIFYLVKYIFLYKSYLNINLFFKLILLKMFCFDNFQLKQNTANKLNIVLSKLKQKEYLQNSMFEQLQQTF